ncbi:AsnC family transcriptional regulator, partial [Mesorhizobium sp.]|uniref:AsnC family transcriptional regulator n=1 Tax=Mesorhizobium sp. TaxID=1871066 RepID=UPI0025BE493E
MIEATQPVYRVQRPKITTGHESLDGISWKQYAKILQYPGENAIFPMVKKLDRADAALLEAVQENNRLTSDELAELVNLSPT